MHQTATVATVAPDARRRVQRYSEWVREAEEDIRRAEAMVRLVETLPQTEGE